MVVFNPVLCVLQECYKKCSDFSTRKKLSLQWTSGFLCRQVNLEESGFNTGLQASVKSKLSQKC